MFPKVSVPGAREDVRAGVGDAADQRRPVLAFRDRHVLPPPHEPAPGQSAEDDSGRPDAAPTHRTRTQLAPGLAAGDPRDTVRDPRPGAALFPVHKGPESSSPVLPEWSASSWTNVRFVA
ncbi:hypothetical protein GCM10025787_44670 [Saccharopolyspora rosea]